MQEHGRDTWMDRYQRVRAATEALAVPLSAEDQLVQSMPDASPTKWHHAHTTWFFETFVLAPRGVEPIHPSWGYLFNSYYEAAGPRHPRPRRGLLSRPSVDEIAAYRRRVDGRVLELVSGLGADDFSRLLPVLELGLAHEEQHQELILTDIQNAFFASPLLPRYRAASATRSGGAPLGFVPFDGGLFEIGADRGRGFAFDNEGPRHKVWVEPFALCARLVTVGELGAFVREGGYQNTSLWLSEGWDFVRSRGIVAPLYGRFEGDVFLQFGLDGERERGPAEPVCHVSFYEADAIARFLGARLPTEAEWEVASKSASVPGAFADSGELRPRIAAGTSLGQMFGDAWEWTSSAYAPYPGYRPPDGALGEYNGKFMVGQQVLRGGSCLTPPGHVRPSYRNFWPAGTRFQMTGIRLARDAGGRT